MDPITISLLLGGTALSAGGGFLGRSEALRNAEREAAARNASLARNIGILNGFGAQNRDTFNSNMGHYEPGAQAQRLDAAQTSRGNANAANITQDTGAATPLPSDTSNASRSDLAKRMLTVFNGATDRAKSMGKLGGYSDAWMQNQLDNSQANRDISVVNNYAEGRKALVQPESDLAAMQAYKPPSIWGPLLQGAGSIMSGAGGARGRGVMKTPAPLWGGGNSFLDQQPVDI